MARPEGTTDQRTISAVVAPATRNPTQKPSGVRRIVHLTAVAAAAVALTPALCASSAAALAAESAGLPETADTGEEKPVIIEEISPRAVKEDSTVTVTGQVTNTTDDALEEVTTRLQYWPNPVLDRSELDSHADGDTEQPPEPGPTAELDEPIPPGESADFELEAEPDDLGLDGFGVYPVAVDAVDGSGDEIGIQHTFLPYQGGGEGSTAVDVAWLWPLMDRPQRVDDDTYLGEDLTNDLGPQGRLNELVAVGAQDGEVALDPPDPGATPQDQATIDSEDAPAQQEDEESGQGDGAEDGGGDGDTAGSPVPITWTVDPGLLSDIHRLTSESYHVIEDPQADDAQPTARTDEPSPDAAAWLDQTREIIGDEPLVTTPYASADIAALLGNDLRSDAEAAMTHGDQAVENILGRQANPNYAVPANGVMSNDTRDFFADQGAERFVLRDAAMPGHDWLGYTPTAQADLASKGDGDDASALVADSGITTVLDAPSKGAGESALAQQRFAAETALISAEQTNTDRTILASPPTDWDPGAEFAADVLRSSEELPWLSPVALDDVDSAASAASDERHGLTYPDDEASDELGGDDLEAVREIRREVRLFNTVLADGGDPFRPAILRAQSAAWRDEDELADQARSLLDQAVTDARDKVRIIESEPVTLASNTGTIGVLVANDLDDETVSVHLSIHSSNSERLSVGEYQESMEIGPGGKTTVYVPLNARVNGRTVLHTSVHNADGEPISTEETEIPVNASGMGTQALLISATGALVLVIALAPRALRKWQRSRTKATSTSDNAAGAGDGTDTDSVADTDSDTAADANNAGAPDNMTHNDNGTSDTDTDGTDDESGTPATHVDEPATDDEAETGTTGDTGQTGEDDNRDH